MDLIEHKVKERMSREQAAARLREIADDLARHNGLRFEREGITFTVDVPAEVRFELEIEVEDDESEIELSISWPATEG